MPPSGDPGCVQSDNMTHPLSITDLPNEMLAIIFCIGAQMWSEGRTRVWELPFPLLVSSVTAHWRLLARSTPRLWSFINPPIHRDRDFCIAETQNWLQRSGSLPISVVIDVRPSLLPDPRSVQDKHLLMLEVVACIADNSITRLRKLDIFSDAPGNIINAGIGMERLCEAINLEQFSFYMFRAPLGGPFVNSDFWSWSTQLPKFRKLAIRGCQIPHHSNLTSLAVFGLRLTYPEAQIMFAALPNLATLVLQQLCPIQPPIPSNSQPINAQSLRCIAVTCKKFAEGLNQTSYLFSLLSIPNVTHLEIGGIGTMFISAVFGDSISDAKIETLRLINIPTPMFGANEEDSRILHAFETLRHLQIVNVPMSAALFSPTTITSSRTRTRSTHLAKPPTIQNSRGHDLGFNPHQGAPASSNDASGPTVPNVNTPWPDLRIISLDTLSASDVALLCEFIGSHRGVHTLELSKTAMRHLSESLRRYGDKIKPLPWRAARAELAQNDVGTKDVQEWLAARVHLTLLPKSSVYGLLDDKDHPYTLPRPI